MKDQVVAVFHPREEDPVLTACLFPFTVFEKGRETGQPFLSAGQQIRGAERIGQPLKFLWIAAFQESIRTLLKINNFFFHTLGQPVMLV